MVKDSPKPMVPINGVPFLEILIRHVETFGFRRFILSAGYKGDIIQDYFNTHNRGLDISIIQEKKPLGTGGAIRSIVQRPEFGLTPEVIAMNGDSFCQFDIGLFYASHKDHNAPITIAISKDAERQDGGNVLCDVQNRITSFSEKNQTTGSINSGIYCLNTQFLTSTMQEGAFSLEKDFFEKLDHNCLRAYRTDVPVYDIGTPERLSHFRSLAFETHSIP